jgi:hypothetical protein
LSLTAVCINDGSAREILVIRESEDLRAFRRTVLSRCVASLAASRFQIPVADPLLCRKQTLVGSTASLGTLRIPPARRPKSAAPIGLESPEPDSDDGDDTDTEEQVSGDTSSGEVKEEEEVVTPSPVVPKKRKRNAAELEGE